MKTKIIDYPKGTTDYSIDDIVLDIDPNFKEETKLRWEAKPVDLIYNTVKR